MGNAPRKAASIWLTATEAAEALGLHNNTVKKIPPGDLPYMRVNARGDRKYARDDVAAYIERRMVRK